MKDFPAKRGASTGLLNLASEGRMIMKIPQDYRPREDDLVSITATVKYDLEPSDSALHLKIGGKDVILFLGGRDPPEIELKRRAFKVGDDVCLAEGDISIGTVRAIHDEWVWITDHNGDPSTYLANVLARYEAPTPPKRKPTAKGPIATLEEIVAAEMAEGEPAAPLTELRSDGAEDDQGEVC